MSLLPALCGFVYAHFIRLFQALSPPCLCAHPSCRSELHAARKCSFIHLSEGIVDLLQLHRFFLANLSWRLCWTLPTTYQFTAQLFIHTNRAVVPQISKRCSL